MSGQLQLEELLIGYKRRLLDLEKRIFISGISVPPWIASSIDNLNTQIAEMLRQSESYVNASIDILPADIAEQIDVLSGNISQLEYLIASINRDASSSTTTNAINNYEPNEHHIKLMEQYIQTIDRFQNQFLSNMTEEISILRLENSKLNSLVERLQEEMERIRNVVAPKSMIDGIEEIEEEIKHQSQIRRELIKRVRVLEIEQARKGINTPAEIDTQISDIRERVTETEARIKILSFDLEKLRPPLELSSVSPVQVMQ